MHSYLSTTDYHRQHAPISGTVVEAYNIQGAAYLGIVVKDGNGETVGYDFNRQLSSTPPNRLCMQRKLINDKPTPIISPMSGRLVPLNKPGYQFLQLRGMIVIDSPNGLVPVLPIGVDTISSVVITCKRGQVLKKGDEISYVQFGGSDIVVVFEERCNIIKYKPGSSMQKVSTLTRKVRDTTEGTETQFLVNSTITVMELATLSALSIPSSLTDKPGNVGPPGKPLNSGTTNGLIQVHQEPRSVQGSIEEPAVDSHKFWCWSKRSIKKRLPPM